MKKFARPRYWTKERVTAALLAFAREFNVIVTSSEEYNRYTAQIKRSQNGRNQYPSHSTVLTHFENFRAAWKACGIKTPRCKPNASEGWTSEEDWFVSEACGILSRQEIADYIERTPNAVHRRLYDLGLNSRTRHGWSVTRLARLTGIPETVITTYIERGELPCYKGTVCTFCDPADFLVITQIDWNNPPKELALAVRHSLMTRLVKILSGQDWRFGRIYRTHAIRTTNKRWKTDWVRPVPKAPSTIRRGDLVTCTKVDTYRKCALGRVGKVTQVYYSMNKKSGERNLPPCWMARVEYPKLKRHGKETPRVTYTFPLEFLQPSKGV